MRRGFDQRIWLIGPAVLLLAVAFVVPVIWLLGRAFTFPTPGLQNFAALWDRPVYLRVLANTLLISATVTPVVLLLGFPVAHAMAHGSPRLRRWLIFLVLVPFWTSLLVRSFATVILLQRHGPLNAFLVGFGFIDEPLSLLYNMTGLLAGAVQVLLPLVIFPLYSAMVRIDPSLMQAAMTLGAGGLRTFWKVTLPNIKWGLLYGVILCNARAMGEFGAVSVVSGHIRGLTNTMPLQVQILYDEHQTVAAFAVASLLALLALLTLLGKGLVEWRAHRAA